MLNTHSHKFCGLQLGFLVSTAALLFGCSPTPTKPINPFAIGNRHIGRLTDSIPQYQLDNLYTQDSIVHRIAGDDFIGTPDEIEVYSTSGKKMLTLEAHEPSDSLSPIQHIQIFDNRFKTSKGLTVGSSFALLKKNYQIAKISNTLSAVMIVIDSLDMYVAIDKNELPPELQKGTDQSINADQIPDSARIKHVWIRWDTDH